MEDAIHTYCLVVYIEKEITKNVSSNILIDDFTDMIDWMAQFFWRLKLVKVLMLFLLNIHVTNNYIYFWVFYND